VAAETANVVVEEPSAEPRYQLEAVVVTGNHKTHEQVILRQLGLGPGDVVTGSDRRVALARLRLLSLGYFLDARLSLARGRARGRAILRVEVEERGTLILTGLYLGTSEATALWGGLDLAETNLLGRGILLSGGFVASTEPSVPEAEAGWAFRTGIAGPAPRPGTWSLAGGLLASRGSEFFRAFDVDDDVGPANHVALTTRRLGANAGVATALSRNTRVSAHARFELIDGRLPTRRVRDLGNDAVAIDFGVRPGTSHLGSVALTLDFDDRSDPLMPRWGRRFLFTLETATPATASDYTFAKGVIQFGQYVPVGAGSALSLHLFLGGIFGSAPYFDRFFIGDLNTLLPSRALGLNFSTMPSRNLLGTSVSGHRFDDFAARVMVEYAVPLWRGRRFVYRSDAFVGLGAFAVASTDDLRFRDDDLARSIPADLTADLGIRFDTYIGIFNFSVANGIGRLPF
jgi:outer membrane protein assembly factor BamA